MDGLVESLMEELNCNVVFTIPLFGGIDVLESVVVTWIITGIIMIASLILVHGLKVRQIGRKQAALEKGICFLYDFFEELLGKDGRAYIPYLITVVIYIAIANMTQDADMLADPASFCNSCERIRKIRVGILKLIARAIISKYSGKLFEENDMAKVVSENIEDISTLIQIESITPVFEKKAPINMVNRPISIN